MDNELQSAIADSLPADATVVPSTTDAPEIVTESSVAPAETPAQQVEQVEPPFHEHPRWKEIQQEKELLRQQNQQMLEIMNKLQQPQLPQQPQVDPEAGLSAEERVYRQQLKQMIREEAERIVEERGAPLQKKIQENNQIIAGIVYERFRSQHPDILPNSPEENRIAELFRQGHSPEDGYKIVKYDELKKKLEAQTKTQQIVKTQQKAAANLEQKTIPSVSGLPAKEKVDFREAMMKNMIAAGY